MKKNLCVPLLAAMTLYGCALTPEHHRGQVVSANSAVLALADTARTDSGGGRLDAAAAGLERALRIESHNPTLWHELAKVRLEQGQAAQAASLAAKSNSWSASNPTLRAANWRIIGAARAQLGDQRGAQTALDAAAKLEQ